MSTAAPPIPVAGQVVRCRGSTPPEKFEELKRAVNAEPATEPLRIFIAKDPGLVGLYTVEVYESGKVADPDGGWRHSRGTLKPDSTGPSFKPIVLENLNDGALRIFAEFVEVLTGAEV